MMNFADAVRCHTVYISIEIFVSAFQYFTRLRIDNK